jgi:CBS domain containing-hemolysin-like protein
MKPSKSAEKLSQLIKRAIDDHQVTNAEYEEILALVHEDGHIDSQEKQMLSQLNDMISNKTVKKVP